jgi:multidrug efflux pump
MQLAEVSIRRPVLAVVMSLLILLIGAVSFKSLSLREYPKIDEPTVTVTTRYVGASAEVIESQVTKPLEDSIAGIDAVDVITSISRAEQSQITVRFRLEKDADTAAAEVRDRTSRVRNRLPQAIEEPVIAKVEADAFPVIWLAFSSDTLNALQINDLVNRVVKPRLQTVTGVADVRIFGERKYAMLVSLDHARLSSFKLTPQDVEDAIRRNNLELPAGRIESTNREFSVSSQTDLNRPGQFGEIVIRSVNGFPVKLRDVAQIKEGAANDRSLVRLNGQSAISAGVIRQATANPLELSAGVREMIPRLKVDLPSDITIDIANDNSVFIDRSIKSVFKTIVEAVVLVALVIFVFLRTVRASIIPIITIPVSRLHHQHPDLAGAGAGHWSGGGRCDCGAGEHLPAHRRRAGSVFCGHQGRARNQLCRGGHDHDVGRSLRPFGFHARTHRQVVWRVCAGTGWGSDRVRFCSLDLGPDAERQTAASQPQAELV